MNNNCSTFRSLFFHFTFILIHTGNMAAFDMSNPESVVSPGGVGFDINCGVRLIRTNLSVEDVEPVKEQLAQVRIIFSDSLYFLLFILWTELISLLILISIVVFVWLEQFFLLQMLSLSASILLPIQMVNPWSIQRCNPLVFKLGCLSFDLSGTYHW